MTTPQRLPLLLTLLALGSLACAPNDLPSSAATALDSPDTFELLSLEPHASPPTYFGHLRLGSTTITDPATQAALTSALRRGIRENPHTAAACFNPRHAIRTTRGPTITDIVICFECLSGQVYVNGHRTDSFLTSESPQPLFDQTLRSADIPLSNKPSP